MTDGARTPSSDAMAMMAYDINKKSAPVAYLLWFFLGAFGAHRFYLGRLNTAIGMLLLNVFGWMLIIVLIGVPMLIALGVWWLVDAFLIAGWLQEHNGRLAAKLGAQPF